MKTVVITGSSRGIGLAAAKKFAVNQYNVVMNCLRDKRLLDENAAVFRKFNKNVIGIAADVSDYEQVLRMNERIQAEFGAADVLINNAGVSYTGLFSDMKPDGWQYVMDTNLTSVFNCCHIFGEQMVKNKSGVIINVSSVWGGRGASCEAVYSASKGAVNAFTKALALELAPCGVRVNAIAFGAIDTRMNDGLSPDEKKDFAETIPLKRFGSAEEAANAAYFLARDEASYITGHILNVDGGL